MTGTSPLRHELGMSRGSCSSKFNFLNTAAGSHEVEMKEQNVQTEESVKQGMCFQLYYII